MYPSTNEGLALGDVGIYGEGTTLALISYGNGYYLCRQAARILQTEFGVSTRVIDIRWLCPLPGPALLKALSGVQSALVVDECRRSGNVSEGLLAMLHENTGLHYARLTAEDSFIPTGPAYAATLPSRDTIVESARELVAGAA